jgi:acyl-CoA synthetase (AMP-forming)/AMP-acid ligase II
MAAGMQEPDWYGRGFWRSEPLWTDLEAAVSGPGHSSRISDDQHELSLGEFLSLARRIAGGLHARGLRTGDAVVIQSRNTIEAFAALCGCFASGLVVIPLPGMFSAAQVGSVIANSGARALLMLDERAGERLAAMGGLGNLVEVFVPAALAGCGHLSIEMLALEHPPAATPSPADADALILYSSGSTGNPKGVVHSGNTLRYVAEALGRFHEVKPRDRVLVALEFGFVGGTILGALTALMAGASIVLMRQWNVDEALRLIGARGITYTLLMPTHVYDVMHSPALAHTDCRSLTRGILAGVPRPVRESAAQRFCARPLPMFGMSESMGHVTFAPSDPWELLMSLDGRALPGTEIEIRDEVGHALPPGIVGDLFLRGPNRLRRYLGSEDLTRASIVAGGWFRTGDRAMLDANGNMLFVGRAKEIIRRGGVTVIPADIEAALLKHPGIAEAAVVPIPDQRLGEKICACIVPRPGAVIDLAEIIRHAGAERLARYQWPEALLLFERLPRTPSLKVRRADLAADVLRRLAGGATDQSS